MEFHVSTSLNHMVASNDMCILYIYIYIKMYILCMYIHSYKNINNTLIYIYMIRMCPSNEMN